MKLYAYRFCPFSRRARIALAEQGVAFEYVELEPKAEHPPELASKTPSKTGVPVLYVHDEFVLWDSSAIVHWVNSAFPTSLSPSAIEPIALADAWVGWASSKLYPAMKDLFHGDVASRRTAKDSITSALLGADALFPNEDWLLGSMYSHADIAMAPVLAVLPPDVVRRFSPKMQRYIEHLKERPAIREVCELESLEGRPSWAA